MFLKRLGCVILNKSRIVSSDPKKKFSPIDLNLIDGSSKQLDQIIDSKSEDNPIKDICLEKLDLNLLMMHHFN